MIRICLADDEAELLALMKELFGNYLAEKAVLCEIDAYENPEPLYWEFQEKRNMTSAFWILRCRRWTAGSLRKNGRKRLDQGSSRNRASECALCNPKVQRIFGSEKRKPYVQDNPRTVQVRKRIRFSERKNFFSRM